MRLLIPSFSLLLLFGLTACEPAEEPVDETATALTWETVQDSTDRIVAVTGFAGPEAVRYDPDQDVYFVSNFNGDVSGDANGFISRVAPDGTVEEMQFMTGTSEAPLHAPRGMILVGDTLWAADADGLHGFNRQTGDHLAFVDFTAFEPGFLNDIAPGPDGALYITDTGPPRLYRMEAGRVEIALEDSLLGPPNGITWDDAAQRLVVVPWGGSRRFHTFDPEVATLEEVGTSPQGGNFDGVEPVGGHLLIASQMDSSLHLLDGSAGRVYIKLPGRPADIGVDTRRMQVAVPYVALNRVDLWQLPTE